MPMRKLAPLLSTALIFSVLLTAVYAVRKERTLAPISRRSPAPAIQTASCPHPGRRSPAWVPGGTLSEVRQAELSLRRAGFARPRPELLAYQRSAKQDYHQNHSALRGGADTAADRGVQAVSGLDARVCRGQRESLRRTTGCGGGQRQPRG